VGGEKTMGKKSTDELIKILEKKKVYNEYLAEYDSEFVGSISTYLNSLMTNINIPELSEKSGLSVSYLYKLFEGKRKNPSRDTLLQICFGLSLDLEQSNKLLKIGGANLLYPRIKRDSIIIFCISKKMSIIECDEILMSEKEKCLKKTYE